MSTSSCGSGAAEPLPTHAEARETSRLAVLPEPNVATNWANIEGSSVSSNGDATPTRVLSVA